MMDWLRFKPKITDVPQNLTSQILHMPKSSWWGASIILKELAKYLSSTLSGKKPPKHTQRKQTAQIDYGEIERVLYNDFARYYFLIGARSFVVEKSGWSGLAVTMDENVSIHPPVSSLPYIKRHLQKGDL